MWLFPIYVLVIYGVPIAVLGAINLACVSRWHLTPKNLLIFVLGGFVGMFVFANLILRALQAASERWRIHGSVAAGEIVGYGTIAIGAEVGGAALVYFWRRW